jgi:hypothetical protein
MSPATLRPLPRRATVQLEEEQAWVSFYRRARHQPAVAAEVLAQLDLDPEMKRAHLALYLCCRESLRLHEERAARDARLVAALRWLGSAFAVRGAGALRRLFGRAGDIALASLPVPTPEPAKAKVRRLAADATLRTARAAYAAAQSAPASVATADTATAPSTTPAAVRSASGA